MVTPGAILLRRDLPGLLDPGDAARPVPGGKRGQTIGGLADLKDHAIIDRGRIVGPWQYDAATRRIVWHADADEPHNMDTDVVTKELARTEASTRRPRALPG